MIQYYRDLKKIIQSDQMKRLHGGQIQKIYSTANYLSLAIRATGKTSHLFIGRGAGHEGLFLSDKAPVSAIRQRERFLEYLRKHLSSCALLYVDIDEYDRIAEIGYQKFGKLQRLALFWMARKLYFAHLYQELPEQPQRLLLSWTNKSIPANESEVSSLYDYFDEVGRRKELDQEGSGKEVSIEEELDKELKQLQLGQLIHRPSFIQRKVKNITEDLENARQWHGLQEFLNSGVEINEFEMTIANQKFRFDSDLNQYEKRNLIFDKIKKLKRGEKILIERLEKVKAQEQENKEAKFKPLPITQVSWGLEKKVIPTKPITHNEYKVIRTEFGSVAWGLTSQGNDQIRNKWASKEDWWFHLDGNKSSHIIVKSVNILTPDQMEIVASILAEVSGYSGDWVPVIFTQVKNLKSVSGRPGMVVYKKQKHINCRRVEVDHFIKEDV